MLRRQVPTGRVFVADSPIFDPASNAVWGVTPAGEVVTVRLLDGRVDVLGSGYTDPVAAVPIADGLTVAVVEAGGSVRVARRDGADHPSARLLVTLAGRALAASRHADPNLLLVLTEASIDGAPAPQLVTCRLDTGDLAVVAADLAGARALSLDDESGQAMVLGTQPDGTSTITSVDLLSGATTTLAGLGPYAHLVGTPDPAQPGVLVVSADPATPGRLVLVDPAGVEMAAEDLGVPVEGLTRWGSLVLAAAGTDLVAVEWGVDDGDLPLTVPLGPLYVSGYTRLTADPAVIGLTPGDVTYAVRESLDGGQISVGIEAPPADGTEPVMLLAGTRPGEYHLDATRTSDGTLLTVRRFRVTALWPDEEVGPRLAITGNHRYTLMSWGGSGAGGSYVQPAPPLLRVLVVMVFVKDRGWEGTDGAAKNEWKDRLVGGGESVRRYYEEVSAFQPGVHGMTVALVGDTVFGPVSVDCGWGDVFKVKDEGDVNAGWLTKPTGYAAMADAISGFLEGQPGGAGILAAADSICVVVRSASDEPVDMGPDAPPLATKYVWGHANSADFTHQDPQRKLPVTVMTDVYPAGAPARNRTFTLAHELGHNIGLADLYDAHDDYPAEINARRPAGVDLMSTSQDLPHFSIANRIRLGWLDRGWLRKFDFSASPVGGSLVLQAAETVTGAGPTGGRVAGIEVPIMDDWSYFFEYRNEQPGQLGDQRLDETVITGRTRILVGTDLRVRGGEVARPPIIFLGKDLDGDGPLLVNDGQDYQDSDTTNPNRMHDFTLALTDLAAPNADSAKVDVTYLEAHRPQLQVRPAPGNGNFRSPDITIFGPLGSSFPVVVKGATNVIKVTVNNLGSLPGTDVRIHVRWVPFTVAPGKWNDLPDPVPFTVPASGSASITVNWPLPSSVKVGDVEAEHFCVRVDVDRYNDPGHPEHGEIVVVDNWAQSNFDTAAVAFGSPSDRVVTAATASNSLERPATYVFGADQSSDFYRIYLGHAWLRLQTAQTRPLELAYESLASDPVFGSEFDQNVERITSRDHHVSISSWVLPDNTDCGAPREVFGVGLDLRAGRRTWIDEVRRNGELVVARVQARSNGVTFPVSGGEFHCAAWADDEPERVTHTVGDVVNGVGRVLLHFETLQDLADGRRVWFVLGRAGDNALAEAVTVPQLFE